MKKLAVVGTFVAGAAVGFVTCGVVTIRGVVKSEKCRKAAVDVIADIISDKVADWLNQKGEQSRRLDRVSYIPYSKRGNTSECLYGAREDAESALTSMGELVSEYGYMSLQDFYDLCAVDKHSPSFETIGWKNIDDAKVVFTGRGYEIIMPETVELDI